MAAIERLVTELERSYAEGQERMSDPAVFSDRVSGAAAGRRLKELEGPHRLARDWREAVADVETAGSDPDLRELLPDAERRLAQIGGGRKAARARRGPADA